MMMYQNYQLRQKWQKNNSSTLIGIAFLILLPLHVFSQNDSMGIKQKPCVSISLDSAKLIVYNENTTALEVVIRNILGIVEANPSYFMEQTEHTEFVAHVDESKFDSSKDYLYSNSDSIRDVENFQLMLNLKTEFKDDYLISDSLKFNYRWIRAGQGREAIIMVNNDKIYLLRRIAGLWKIYVWTKIDFYDQRTYEIFDDN